MTDAGKQFHFARSVCKSQLDNSISSSMPREEPLGGITKRGFDIAVALILLIILLPVILLIAGLIVASDRGSIFFRHRRIGFDGCAFDCLKFRTMYVDGDSLLQTFLVVDSGAAAEWAATRKLKHDPRVTKLGKLLRATSMDEIPQLVNVLRGEMSLVGPRPIVQAEAVRYGAAFDAYRRARPGITGLWQVSGRSDRPYIERVKLDERYVEEWCFSRDIRILVRTIPAVLTGHGSC